jgi:hypothetical protein
MGKEILLIEPPRSSDILIVRRTEEMSIFPSLQTKLQFLENVVILSFGDPPPGTRNDWIRTEIETVFPNLSPAQKDRLMLLSNTINTLGEARERLREAREERDKERQFLLQQGDLI